MTPRSTLARLMRLMMLAITMLAGLAIGPARAQGMSEDLAYVSGTFGIPLRDGYLLYDNGATDANSAAWSQFLTMNTIVSAEDPVRSNTWRALEPFFYWYYDDAAREQFIRAFAPPNEVEAMVRVYLPRKKFFQFFGRLSEFERADLIDQLYAQIQAHPSYRPVTGPLKVVVAQRFRTSSYDFSRGRLQFDGLQLRMNIANRDRSRQGFAFGWGVSRIENARPSRDLRMSGVPMARGVAQALIQRLHRASGEDVNPLSTSSAPIYAGLFGTISADRKEATLDRVVLYEDAQLTRPIRELNGADFWENLGARRAAEQAAEAARLAAAEAEAKRQEEARLEAERLEAERIAAEQAAARARVAADRSSKPLAVLGIRIGMTEAEAKAALAEASPDFTANLSRTGFERLLGGSNVADGPPSPDCARAYEGIARPFAEYRATLVDQSDLADPWFLPTRGADVDAQLLAKSLELSAGLAPACRFETVAPGASFETYTDYENETIRDSIRVFIGQRGPQAGRVTAVVRALIHRNIEMDLFGQSQEAYGAPNYTGTTVKYWLAATDAPVVKPDPQLAEIGEDPARPPELAGCLGARRGPAGELLGAVGVTGLKPYGAPPLTKVSLDLSKRIAAPCGTVLGIEADPSRRTTILLIDTGYVMETRQAREAAPTTKPGGKSKSSIKF